MGNQITINADGQVTSNYAEAVQVIYPLNVENGVYRANVGLPNYQVGGAGFIVVPAGVADLYPGNIDDRDRILIGQDLSYGVDHPYYRAEQ